MKTEIEINELAARFDEWLDEEYSVGGCGNVVRTRETAKDFYKAAFNCHAIDDGGDFEGYPVKIICNFQRAKGDQRKDIYILEVEDGVNLTLVY